MVARLLVIHAVCRGGEAGWLRGWLDEEGVVARGLAEEERAA